MALTATVAIALAAVLDEVVAEPPLRVHPVAWFGRFVAVLDCEWTHPLVAGGTIALVLPFVAAAITAGTVWVAGGLSPWAGALAAGLVLFSTTSRRMLLDLSTKIVAATESDLETARAELRALAGRDATDLSADEIRSAAVESAAENLADGLVGPLLAFSLVAPVSLAGAAGAAAWVKAVNTLDSMLGYRHKPVGTVPARLDDVVMWLPARISAALLALVAGAPSALHESSRLARRPASPNSGWPMATLAVLLDTRLEKPDNYRLDGGTELPNVATATRGISLVSRAGIVAFALAGVIAWF
ncbi:adenosylcobinamide-phosphate synthase CbiB [Haloferax namakaokahaiae]|uniref:Probable cobalamin biosynthesis protein CobD n=1 Tax=Haloferax namakaokahaiae TaxID=1748331 RepID=A0ABD5ZH59_9EURY